MKIRLLTSQHLLVPAGTEIDVDDGRAALLIEIGAAERLEPAKVEKAVKKPTETAKKNTAEKRGDSRC